MQEDRIHSFLTKETDQKMQITNWTYKNKRGTTI